MKTTRSMVLVSNDLQSINLGAQEIYQRLQEKIRQYGMDEEISLSMIGDVGRHDALPMVIVYPEAVIYGPCEFRKS